MRPVLARIIAAGLLVFTIALAAGFAWLVNS